MQKKQESQKITLRLSRQLLEELRQSAVESRRSLNGEIEWRLWQSVKGSSHARIV